MFKTEMSAGLISLPKHLSLNYGASSSPCVLTWPFPVVHALLVSIPLQEDTGPIRLGSNTYGLT